MVSKKYYFYVHDKELQDILDELKKNNMLSDILEEIVVQGLEKQIKRKIKLLEKLSGACKK